MSTPTLIRRKKVVILLVLTLLSLADTHSVRAADAGRADPSFVSATLDSVAFIQWTESKGGYLTGQFQALFVISGDPPRLDSFNSPFTGLRSGQNISLTFSALFSTRVWTGTLRGHRLTLVIPRSDGLLTTFVMRAGTVEEYNKAATALKQQVAVLTDLAARRDAVVRADRALRSTYSNLAEDIGHLARVTDFSGVLEEYRKAWARMQHDQEKLRTDAAKHPFDCYQLNTVRYDLNTLEYDMNSIRYVNNTFSSIRRDVLTATDEVRADLVALKRALTNLQRAAAHDPNKTVTTKYLAQIGAIVEQASSEADRQIRASRAALESAEMEAQRYNQRASRLLKGRGPFERILPRYSSSSSPRGLSLVACGPQQSARFVARGLKVGS